MKTALVTAWLALVAVAFAYGLAGAIRFSGDLARAADARKAIVACNAEGYHLQDCVKWHGGSAK